MDALASAVELLARWDVLVALLIGSVGGVIIGAMVLAPLLGPNIGVALATTLGDIKLGIRSLQTTTSIR